MLLNRISIGKDILCEKVSQSFGKVDFFNLSTQADKTNYIPHDEKPTACPTQSWDHTTYATLLKEAYGLELPATDIVFRKCTTRELFVP